MKHIVGIILLLELLCLSASGFKLYCDYEDWNGQWATNGTLYADGEPTDQKFSDLMQLEVNGRTARGAFGSGGSVSGEFPGGVVNNFAGKWSKDGEEGTFHIQLQDRNRNCSYFEGWMTKEYGKREWYWRGEKYESGLPINVGAMAGQKEGSCEDRSSEFMILDPVSTPPNCKYTCKDRSSEGYEKPDELRSGELLVKCDYISCKKGFGFDSEKSKKCLPCEEWCHSLLGPNSIYIPEIQWATSCHCDCDRKNGYSMDENGTCIIKEDKISKALLANDPKTTAIAFLSVFSGGDTRTQKMAILAIRQCYPRWNELPEHVKFVLTRYIDGSPSEYFWIKQQFK
jgi:hypothetical protein